MFFALFFYYLVAGDGLALVVADVGIGKIVAGWVRRAALAGEEPLAGQRFPLLGADKGMRVPLAALSLLAGRLVVVLAAWKRDKVNVCLAVVKLVVPAAGRHRQAPVLRVVPAVSQNG